MGAGLTWLAYTRVTSSPAGPIDGATSLGQEIWSDSTSAINGDITLSGWMAWYLAWCTAGLITMLGIASWRLRGIAHLIEDGRYERTQDTAALEGAQRTAAIRRAKQACAHLPAIPAIIGVAITSDDRSFFRRLQAPRQGTPERQKAVIDQPPGAWRWAKTGKTLWATVPLERQGARTIRAVVTGNAGSGKTNLLIHKMRALLEDGEDVVFIDGKGTKDAVIDLAAMGLDIGCDITFDSTDKGSGYDLMEGGIQSIIALFGEPGLDSAVAYHYAGTVGALEAADTAHWESIEDLLDVLEHPEQHPDLSPAARLTIMANATSANAKGMSQGKSVAGQLRQMQRNASRLSRAETWTWENPSSRSRLVIVAVPGDKPESVIYTRAIVAGFNGWRQGRSPGSRRCTLFLDEAGAILNHPMGPDLAVAIEQVRSQNLGMVMAAQSFHSLGEQGKRILGAGVDQMIGQVDEPEELIIAGGTIMATEAGQSRDMGGSSKSSSGRIQHQYAINPNLVRHAPLGVFAVVAGVPMGTVDGRAVGWVVVAPSRTRPEAAGRARAWLAKLQAEVIAAPIAPQRPQLPAGPNAGIADDIKRAFREAAKTVHPDHGGNEESMRRLIELRDQAMAASQATGPVLPPKRPKH